MSIICSRCAHWMVGNSVTSRCQKSAMLSVMIDRLWSAADYAVKDDGNQTNRKLAKNLHKKG